MERFSERARRVVEVAEEEARQLDHPYVRTEHLLLGLLAVGGPAHDVPTIGELGPQAAGDGASHFDP